MFIWWRFLRKFISANRVGKFLRTENVSYLQINGNLAIYIAVLRGFMVFLIV